MDPDVAIALRLNSDDIDLYATTAAFASDLAPEESLRHFPRCQIWDATGVKIVYISTACSTSRCLSADFAARMSYAAARTAVRMASPHTTVVIVPIFHRQATDDPNTATDGHWSLLVRSPIAAAGNVIAWKHYDSIGFNSDKNWTAQRVLCRLLHDRDDADNCIDGCQKTIPVVTVALTNRIVQQDVWECGYYVCVIIDHILTQCAITEMAYTNVANLTRTLAAYDDWACEYVLVNEVLRRARRKNTLAVEHPNVK